MDEFASGPTCQSFRRVQAQELDMQLAAQSGNQSSKKTVASNQSVRGYNFNISSGLVLEEMHHLRPPLYKTPPSPATSRPTTEPEKKETPEAALCTPALDHIAFTNQSLMAITT